MIRWKNRRAASKTMASCCSTTTTTSSDENDTAIVDGSSCSGGAGCTARPDCRQVFPAARPVAEEGACRSGDGRCQTSAGGRVRAVARSSWDFEKDQVRTFGVPLGPLPKQRAATNGIILRHGYIVAQFGDIKAADPVYSVAKSFL